MTVEEQKYALFADDVLIYLNDPTQSLPSLMLLLNDYGSFSGYKLNVQKTWTLIPHRSLSSCIETIKINILPRILCLFQSIPIHTAEK